MPKITEPEELPSGRTMLLTAIIVLLFCSAFILLPFDTLIHGSNLWREPVLYLLAIGCWAFALLVLGVTASGIASGLKLKYREKRKFKGSHHG